MMKILGASATGLILEIIHANSDKVLVIPELYCLDTYYPIINSIDRYLIAPLNTSGLIDSSFLLENGSNLLIIHAPFYGYCQDLNVLAEHYSDYSVIFDFAQLKPEGLHDVLIRENSYIVYSFNVFKPVGIGYGGLMKTWQYFPVSYSFKIGANVRLLVVLIITRFLRVHPVLRSFFRSVNGRKRQRVGLNMESNVPFLLRFLVKAFELGLFGYSYTHLSENHYGELPNVCSSSFKGTMTKDKYLHVYKF